MSVADRFFLNGNRQAVYNIKIISYLEHWGHSLIYLLQDSSTFILSSLRSRKAEASFKDIWFTPKTEEASINLSAGLKNKTY